MTGPWLVGRLETTPAGRDSSHIWPALRQCLEADPSARSERLRSGPLRWPDGRLSDAPATAGRDSLEICLALIWIVGSAIALDLILMVVFGVRRRTTLAAQVRDRAYGRHVTPPATTHKLSSPPTGSDDSLSFNAA